MNRRASVIGSGFSGLVSAGLLADQNLSVSLFEKNAWLGGRASHMCVDGFHFDKGPSWYWMPDIYDRIFKILGYDRSDFYKLKRLDPAFRVYFGHRDFVDVPDNYDELRALFESLEKGAADQLDAFMREAQTKYEIGVGQMARMPGLSIMEFASFSLLKSASQMDLFSSVAKHVRTRFSDERIRMIMEFPVLFLGASAKRIPALYTMMNYAGLKLGTFYPEGGFAGVVKAFEEILIDKGVEIHKNAEVTELIIKDRKIEGIEINGDKVFATDVCVGAGDYAHMDGLMPFGMRNYTEDYWSKRVFAPSALLFYIGVNKKLDHIQHHNLFFHSDFETHISEIYHQPDWPSDPLFYVCCPSKTDQATAPEGCENLFFLMPIATGIEDTESLRESYFSKLISSFESLTGESIQEHIMVRESYCIKDFVDEYHAYAGNAYGLANTLRQTAILKPSIRNKHVSNVFYTGQLTVPGPGVPPAIISGEIVADYIKKSFISKKSPA